MEDRNTAGQCPPERLSEVTASIGADQAGALEQVERLLDAYQRDARLHFLKGSLLAGLGHYPEARRAMETATRLAPDYMLARFQLGFLELTSGDAVGALATWRPLAGLAADNPLRLFARGLEHLINDEFPEAVAVLEAGIARNAEIPPMNADMRLIIDKIAALPTESAVEPLSAAGLLLKQYGANPTKH